VDRALAGIARENTRQSASRPFGSGWPGTCTAHSMKITIPCFCNAALLSAALIVPSMMAPSTLRAEERQTTATTVRTYHDTKNNDSHEWNSREDQAYRAYSTENHRKTVEFYKLKPKDQQAYWGWRHEHSDSLLKIEIK
jgi:hypothetical protein